MPNLKSLRTRINSVKSTQKITSAMKMVAASKLRRAQAQAEAARPYAERMERMLRALAASVAGSPTAPPLMVGHRQGPDASADRGHRRPWSRRRVQLQHRPRRARPGAPLEAEGKTVKLLAVGRKGRDYLRRELSSRIVGDINYVGKRRVEFADADEIASRVTADAECRRDRQRHHRL